jgi:3-hydroxy-3-methylglutaryl CoA synthase
VANFDEDAITMGVEASRECLRAWPRKDVSALYFASTTHPYAEKQSAVLVAAALDLDASAFTADISGTLRSGTGAVKLALDAVKAAGAGDALVCASDLRMGLAGGAKEMEFGDGAAALLISAADPLAVIDAVYSAHNELYDVYRASNEWFVRSWEDRFVREAGYLKVVPETVRAALTAFGAQPADFAKAVFAAPNPGYLSGAVAKCGFDPKTQAVDILWPAVGCLGAAHPLAVLAAALDAAKPGDRLLWVSYGDGCDVMALTVTDRIVEAQKHQRVAAMLASKAPTTYQKYLRWRELVPIEPPMRPKSEPPSAPALYRDRKCGLALYGARCNKCGTVQYPVQRICMECRARDEFELYPFSDKQGAIVTFSHDNLAVSPDPPTTLAVVDFEGGGRIMMDVTDRDVAAIKIGLPLEMTFRKFRHTEGIQVYWWKSRPKR